MIHPKFHIQSLLVDFILVQFGLFFDFAHVVAHSRVSYSPELMPVNVPTRETVGHMLSSSWLDANASSALF
jgi:hypothetical protein